MLQKKYYLLPIYMPLFDKAVGNVYERNELMKFVVLKWTLAIGVAINRIIKE